MPWPFFSSKKSVAEAPTEEWGLPSGEGQLLLDVFRDAKNLIIRSPIAGVDPERLDIAVDGDLLTIRGEREERKDINDDDWFYSENYWGAFSRSIILPVDVEAEKAEASLKNGVLEIRIPIREGSRHLKVHSIEPKILD